MLIPSHSELSVQPVISTVLQHVESIGLIILLVQYPDYCTWRSLSIKVLTNFILNKHLSLYIFIFAHFSFTIFFNYDLTLFIYLFLSTLLLAGSNYNFLHSESDITTATLPFHPHIESVCGWNGSDIPAWQWHLIIKYRIQPVPLFGRVLSFDTIDHDKLLARL